ncbi:hypothetical protein LCGC14_1129840 [marine sediment metagenome]|uniref:Uncharacterized protein n=1 Tax=marine sediment metagenome TaxID=412755 RepID=A0A0F9M1C1_9ZZZZ
MPSDHDLFTEKQRRIYYQSIIYAICDAVDEYHGSRQRVLCGSVDDPSDELQKTVSGLLKRLAKIDRPKRPFRTAYEVAEAKCITELMKGGRPDAK